MSRKITKTNPHLITLIHELKQASHKHDAPIWKDIAKRLEKPLRNWPVVNLNRIDRCINEKETALIPGKVVSTGTLSKKVSIAAWGFTEKAEKKIKQAGGTSITLNDVLKNNPKGTNIRIVG
jgi:large subunit ribosomal protein L18e